MLQIFFFPLVVVNACPYLALLPAAVFALLYTKLAKKPDARPARVILVTAIMWSLYGVYEWNVARQYPPESVPIRVDLLLLGPALYALTIAGVVKSVSLFRQARRTQSARA